MLLIDDYCEEISNSKFVKFATAERHRELNTKHIKQNLFHQSKVGRDVELQNTHIVLFKSPREVLQTNTLRQQLGLQSQLKEWYQDATSITYGLFLIDFTPKTVDSLKYCANSGSTQPKISFTSKNRHKNLEDEHNIRLYTPNISNVFPKTIKTIHPPLFKKFHSVPQQISSKFARRRATGSSKSIGSKISERNIRLHTKKNFTAQKNKSLELAKRLTIKISYHSCCHKTIDIVCISLF